VDDYGTCAIRRWGDPERLPVQDLKTKSFVNLRFGRGSDDFAVIRQILTIELAHTLGFGGLLRMGVGEDRRFSSGLAALGPWAVRYGCRSQGLLYFHPAAHLPRPFWKLG